MSDDYVERKEFLSSVKDLRNDIQNMQQTLNNGVKRRAEENQEAIKENNKELKEINSKLDKAEGGFSTLRLIGITIASAITVTGSLVGILKVLGALGHLV